MKIITGFMMTWGSFCAIPCPAKLWNEKARKWSLATLPLLGLMLGLLWFICYNLLEGLLIPLYIKSAIMTIFPFLITGHIHLDGFMDCSDAIMSRRDMEEKRRILKDSHVGAFAVISLVMMILVMYGAMSSIIVEGRMDKIVLLVMLPPMARAIVALDVMRKEPMSTSQYDQTFDGEFKKYIPFIAFTLIVGIVIVVTLSVIKWEVHKLMMVCVLIVPFVTAGFAGAHGRKQLGGMNGDIAGYSIVLGEMAGVIALAVL